MIRRSGYTRTAKALQHTSREARTRVAGAGASHWTAHLPLTPASNMQDHAHANSGENLSHTMARILRNDASIRQVGCSRRGGQALIEGSIDAGGERRPCYASCASASPTMQERVRNRYES